MQLCCGICWCEWICPSQLLWLSFLVKILRTIPPNKASESWRNNLSRHVSKSFIIRRHLWIYHIHMPIQEKKNFSEPSKIQTSWVEATQTWQFIQFALLPKRIMSFLTNGNSSKTRPHGIFCQHRSSAEQLLGIPTWSAEDSFGSNMTWSSAPASTAGHVCPRVFYHLGELEGSCFRKQKPGFFFPNFLRNRLANFLGKLQYR